MLQNLAATQIGPSIWRMTAGQPEIHSPRRLVADAPLDQALEAMPPALPPAVVGETQYSVLTRGVLLNLPLAPDEHIYGFGLQLKSVRQDGRKKTLRVNSDPVADTGDSHAPVPFYLSTAGYGVLVDTSRYAAFYVGSHHPRRKAGSTTSRSDKAIAVTTEDLYSSGKSATGSVMVDIPVARGVDVYVFGGPSMLEALRRYILFSGGGCLPPLWGLGVWYRGYGRFNQEEALALARTLRSTRMPCDVFGLEPGWQSHAYSCSLTWDPGRFPNPPALLDELGRTGFKTNLWEHVFIHPSSPLHPKLLEQSGDVEVWGGLVPDLSLDSARKQFSEYHRTEFVQAGVSGFKLDECDSSDFQKDPWSFPNHTQFPGGMDGEQMHNVIGQLYQLTIRDAFQRENRRTYGSVRSAQAWAAPLPFVLYSDLYNHRDFLRGMVTAGLSGLLWTPEVRDASSAEDFLRRLQSVALSPQMLINTWTFPSPPWWQTDRELNEKGKLLPEPERLALESTCRRILEGRMRLIPYLYAAFARYRFEGIPPFRPLILDFPNDERVRDIDDAWLMGDSLLAVPLVAGETTRQIYLPAGRWHEVDGPGTFEGGQSHTLQFSTDRLPLLARDNTLLPLADPVQYVSRDTEFSITVHVYGNHPPALRLLVDDGETLDYQSGKKAWLELSWDEQTGGTARTVGTSVRSRYRIKEWIRHP